MVRRTRDIQKKIWLTPQEERTIAKKMEMIGTENFGAYARKMLIDGYIIVVDYTEQKKLAAEINKIGVNINTVCRRINSTGRFYQDDIDELKRKDGRGMAVTKIKAIRGTLSKAIAYILNPEKTDEKLLVSSYGCASETAAREFEWTRKIAEQRDESGQDHSPSCDPVL